MASSSRARTNLTLEEFLELPDRDDKPYREYIDGRIEAKVSPSAKHNVVAVNLNGRVNGMAIPAGLGMAFVELRCTYAGRSIIPDVVFLFNEHIARDKNDEFADEMNVTPDIHVEINSPRQARTKAQRKLVHSTAHGCALGLFIDPVRKTIAVYRPGREPEWLPADAAIDFAPVLPGFSIPVAEVFTWLKPPLP